MQELQVATLNLASMEERKIKSALKEKKIQISTEGEKNQISRGNGDDAPSRDSLPERDKDAEQPRNLIGMLTAKVERERRQATVLDA